MDVRGWRYVLGTYRGVRVEAHGTLLLMVGWLALRQAHLAATVLFFALVCMLVLVHELAHSAAARWRGYGVSRIVLHAFGGLSGLETPPSTMRDDLPIALAGPGASLAAGAALLELGAALGPTWTGTVIGDAATTVLYWSLFNLLPAFPMDGGRILRRLLAGGNADLAAATLRASRIGRIVIGLVGLYGLLSLSLAWLLLSAYLYVSGTIMAARLTLESRDNADTATVGPPPYARSRSQRVDVRRLD